MSRLDESIANVANILDALMAYREIARSGDCNNCSRRKCQYKPDVGKLVRYNCPYWKAIGEHDETN